MEQLPTGTITFLFTDLEGSTRLLQRLKEGYPGLLEEHARLIRRVVEQAGGHEVGTEGDAFFLVFPSAPAAVWAAAEIQSEIASHAWPRESPYACGWGCTPGREGSAETTT